MDFNRKIPIGTSGLNAQLLNHAASKQQGNSFVLAPPIVSPITSGGIVDGVDHAPAFQTLPRPIGIFKMFQPTPSATNPTKPARKNFFTDLFAARKANQ